MRSISWSPLPVRRWPTRASHHGNPGDVKNVGRGVSELRLAYGPGTGSITHKAVSASCSCSCGGDKSTQENDIGTAHRFAADRHARENDHDH